MEQFLNIWLFIFALHLIIMIKSESSTYSHNVGSYYDNRQYPIQYVYAYLCYNIDLTIHDIQYPNWAFIYFT